MRRWVLVLLAAVPLWLDVVGPDGRRSGYVRERPGGQIDLFDADSRRLGWGRRNPDGSIELFDGGRRLGTVTRDGVFLPGLAGPGRRERGRGRGR